jgi:hypothetical protein
VTAEGPYSGAAQALNVPTPSEARSSQLVATKALYHFTFVPDANIPLVTVSVEGPTPAAAGNLANAVVPGVRTWLASLQAAVPTYHRVTIRQLGDAQAGEINASSSTTLAGVAGFAVLLMGLLVIVLVENRRNRRAPLLSATIAGPSPSTVTFAEPTVGNGHKPGPSPQDPDPATNGHFCEPLGAAMSRARQHNRSVEHTRSVEPGERSAESSEQRAGATS